MIELDQKDDTVSDAVDRSAPVYMRDIRSMIFQARSPATRFATRPRISAEAAHRRASGWRCERHAGPVVLGQAVERAWLPGRAGTQHPHV
jgi:hypothetical protein